MALLWNGKFPSRELPKKNRHKVSKTWMKTPPWTAKSRPSLVFPGNRVPRKKAPENEKDRSVAFLCLGIAAIATSLLAIHGIPMTPLLSTTPWGKTFLYAVMFLGALALVELAWRAVLVFLYKPVPGCEDGLLPKCSVIVPAFNEGKQVFETLKSLAASDYPVAKLQMIAIDDGSVDDTWAWIRKAKEVFQERLTIIKHPRNKGKRHALYSGIQRSTGEILITVDSDSMVVSDTLRNLVAPFVVDKKIGAVAGNVRVLNTDQGIIPKMLDVIFVYGFDYIRASQSMVKAVMCTPGALSAYRRDIILSVLEEWIAQKFLGKPANIGEDRAITNLILRAGYHVVFQRNSRVFTEVPVKYSNLCKMLLRWARSDFRENIAMIRFIFRPFRSESMIGARINLLLSWIAIINALLFFTFFGYLVAIHPITAGINIFLGVIFSSSLAALIYAWKFGTYTALWAYLYGIYFFVSLSWILPYAVITPHNSGWLTRQRKQESPPGYEPPLLIGSYGRRR